MIYQVPTFIHPDECVVTKYVDMLIVDDVGIEILAHRYARGMAKNKLPKICSQNELAHSYKIGLSNLGGF